MSRKNAAGAIAISLTQEEWGEVVYALLDKRAAIAEGVYGRDRAWVATLTSALRKLDAALKSAGVAF